MADSWLTRVWRHDRQEPHWQLLVQTYQTLGSVSVEELWHKVVDLADVSWNPLLSSTDLPYGLIPKPGLIYQAVMRRIPIPVKIFVERVNPGESLSVRILIIPGIEERVTYQVSSTLLGTQITCAITLRGFLSPLFGSLIKSSASRLAAALAQAAEQSVLSPPPPPKDRVFDF
jgi:hypothetical protein